METSLEIFVTLIMKFCKQQDPNNLQVCGEALINCAVGPKGQYDLDQLDVCTDIYSVIKKRYEEKR